MTKLQDPSEFLKGDFANAAKVTEIIFLEEGGYSDKTFKNDKGVDETKNLFEAKVQCNDENKSIKTYTPNATSIKKLMEISDGDTKNIVGKRIPIIVSYNANKYLVYVKPDLTKQQFLDLNKSQEATTQSSGTTTS